jgi:hypothetical protein
MHLRALTPTSGLPACCRTVSACALVADGGGAFAFTATQGQAVLCWDLRAQKPLYELATGNTEVGSLAWDAATRTLLAASGCPYQDRLGGSHEYGQAQGFAWPHCFHMPRDFPHPWDARSHLVVAYKFCEAPDLEAVPREADEASEPEDEGEGGGAWRPTRHQHAGFW